MRASFTGGGVGVALARGAVERGFGSSWPAPTATPATSASDGGDREGQPPPPGLGRHPESSRSAWPAASPSSVITSRSTRLSTSQRWW